MEHRVQQCLLLPVFRRASVMSENNASTALPRRKHQTHAHPGRKQHRQPRQEAEFRHIFIPSEPDVSQTADREYQQETQKNGKR